MLGVGENQDAGETFLLEDIRQQVLFILLSHIVKLLHNRLHRRRLRRHLHASRVMQKRLGKLCNFLRHRGRKKQRLPFFRQPSNDFSNIPDEAHVQHPVGFIQNENFQSAQVHIALVVQINQPPRRRHQHVDASPDRLDLRVLAHAAKDYGGTNRQIFGVPGKALLNLQCELSSRRENQPPNGLMRPADAALQPLENGNCKSRRFPRTRLGAANQIPTGQNLWDRGGLNRRRARISDFLHSLQNRRQ